MDGQSDTRLPNLFNPSYLKHSDVAFGRRDGCKAIAACTRFASASCILHTTHRTRQSSMVDRYERQFRCRWFGTGRFLNYRRQGRVGPGADKAATNLSLGIDEDVRREIFKAETPGDCRADARSENRMAEAGTSFGQSVKSSGAPTNRQGGVGKRPAARAKVVRDPFQDLICPQ